MGIKETVFNLMDGTEFSRSLMLRRLRREVQAKVDEIPPARIREMIVECQPPQLLIKLLVSQFAPGKSIQEVQAQAREEYSWLAEFLTNDEAPKLLPSWCRALVNEYGDEGWEWLHKEVAYARGFFFGQGQGAGAVGGRDHTDRAGGAPREGTKTFVYRARTRPTGPASEPAGPAGPAPGGTEAGERRPEGA